MADIKLLESINLLVDSLPFDVNWSILLVELLIIFSPFSSNTPLMVIGIDVFKGQVQQS